ncbi:MAG TPA: hypothetical protein VK534_01630 [Methylomirabilota bacterium]|nr:hypothetical protein [Methylomirabilota bacterium]
MTSKRLYTLLLVTIGVLFIGLLGGAYFVNKLLVAESSDLVTLKAKSQAQEQEKLSLKVAKRDIAKYSELEKITKAIVPEDKNQAEAAREIVNIASANNIKLASITFPASTLGNTPVGSATSVAPTTAAVSSSKADLSQLQPVKNIPGVYQLLITVASDPNKPVQYNQFLGFLGALEHNRRTAQVSTILLQPDTENRNYLTFSLTLNEYIKP